MADGINTVTLSVASREDVNRRVLAAFGGAEQGAHISFGSVDLLWQTLTRERWALLQAMTGQGPTTVRELSEHLGRAFAEVWADAEALLNAGVLDRQGERVVFPFDAVHVDFTLTKAA